MHLTLKIAVNKFLIFLFIGELINHVLKGLRLMWNIKNYFKTIELTSIEKVSMTVSVFN